MNKYLRDKYIGLFACIGFSIYFIFLFIAKEKIDHETDLALIRGPLYAYSFEDNMGWKKMGSRYVIMLENYKNKFQIKADYLRCFPHFIFMEKVQEGDTIILTIPPSQRKKLNSDKNAFVTSVRTKYQSYLRLDDVIKVEKSYALLYGSVGFLILGFIFYKFRDSWN